MKHINKGRSGLPEFWSGRRVSNSRPQPWQGCALPTELLPLRSVTNDCYVKPGAGEESRTLDLNLGKVALYQLSYSRMEPYNLLRLPTTAPAETGAGEESRTLDLNLGKVALYQLSYSRVQNNDYDRSLTFFQDRFATLQSLEREKSLELSTSTLARLRSTN